MAELKVVVHVDGGARGNPGPAAAGAVLSTPDGEVLTDATEAIGVATNNVAEYRGLLLGLERARQLGASEVEVVNDSELVAKTAGCCSGSSVPASWAQARSRSSTTQSSSPNRSTGSTRSSTPT